MEVAFFFVDKLARILARSAVVLWFLSAVMVAGIIVKHLIAKGTYSYKTSESERKIFQSVEYVARVGVALSIIALFNVAGRALFLE